MNFCDWIELNELKTPKKAKAALVTHTDIDRWLKSVDGFAKDLQDLKKAKEKSQSKLTQIKKKYDPEKIEKPELKPEKEVEKSDQRPTEKPEDQKPQEEVPKEATPKEKELPDEKFVPRDFVSKRVNPKSKQKPEME